MRLLKKIAYKLVDIRFGDVVKDFVDPKKANEELVWKAERWIKEIYEGSWSWKSNNLKGYNS